MLGAKGLIVYADLLLGLLGGGFSNDFHMYILCVSFPVCESHFHQYHRNRRSL
jgi:hypothetical protein